MFEAGKFELTLLDEQGKPKQKWSNFQASSDTTSLRELLKAHSSEALNDFRFFGTLRATISWLPALLALTMISYATAQIAAPAPSETAQVAALILPAVLSGFLVITLVLIFFTQRSLEKLQDRRRKAAVRAQELFLQLAEGMLVHPLTYQALLEEVAGERTGVKWDASSRALFLFFLLLMAGQTFFVLWRAGAITGMNAYPWISLSLWGPLS